MVPTLPTPTCLPTCCHAMTSYKSPITLWLRSLPPTFSSPHDLATRLTMGRHASRPTASSQGSRSSTRTTSGSSAATSNSRGKRTITEISSDSESDSRNSGIRPRSTHSGSTHRPNKRTRPLDAQANSGGTNGTATSNNGTDSATSTETGTNAPTNTSGAAPGKLSPEALEQRRVAEGFRSTKWLNPDGSPKTAEEIRGMRCFGSHFLNKYIDIF